jgi:hypothetical protein
MFEVHGVSGYEISRAQHQEHRGSTGIRSAPLRSLRERHVDPPAGSLSTTGRKSVDHRPEVCRPLAGSLSTTGRKSPDHRPEVSDHWPEVSGLPTGSL